MKRLVKTVDEQRAAVGLPPLPNGAGKFVLDLDWLPLPLRMMTEPQRVRFEPAIYSNETYWDRAAVARGRILKQGKGR